MNPQYTHIRFPNGKETTVSVWDLALQGDVPNASYETDGPQVLNSIEEATHS